MANKIIRNTELRIDLSSLVKYIDTAQTVNLNSIELYYDTSEVTWSLPPQAALGSSNVTAIWIGGVRHVGVVAWTRAWNAALQTNQNQGILISKGRPLTVTAVNLANSTGRRLTTVATTTLPTVAATTSTVQQVVTAPQLVVPGPKGDQGLPGLTGPRGLQGIVGATGVQGPAGSNGTNGTNGVSVQSLSVNQQGNLIVTLSNSATVNAGYVVGPSPVLTVGTVTAGATPSVSITGGPTNYTLGFVLQAGPAGSGSGDVSTLSLYDNPVWINSLASTKITGLTAGSVGLGNVTNESKATMFSSPTFTGTVSGVSATAVGLGNVTNESKATMFSSPTFTGTVSGVSATAVGLGNVTNESKATMFSSPTFTGTTSVSVLNANGSTGTAGQFLQSNGASAAAWASPGARTLITSTAAVDTDIDCAGYSELEIFYRPGSVNSLVWLIFKDNQGTPAGIPQNYQVSRWIGIPFSGGTSLAIQALRWDIGGGSSNGELIVAAHGNSQGVAQDGNFTSQIHLKITGWGTNNPTVIGTGYVQGNGGSFGDWNTTMIMTATGSNVARYITLKQSLTGFGASLRIWGYR